VIVVLGNKAEKKLEKIHKGDKKNFSKIIETIYEYAGNSGEHFDVKQLEGETCKFRIRVNNYRILFKIENNNMIIVDVDVRGNIYKK